MAHVLDGPIWAAAHGRQAHLIRVRGQAAMYHPSVSPLATLRPGHDERAWADLATLAEPGTRIGLAGVTAAPPPGWDVEYTIPGVQMVATAPRPAPDLLPPGPAGVLPPGPGDALPPDPADIVPPGPAGAARLRPADIVPPGYADIVPPGPAGPAGAVPLRPTGAIPPGRAGMLPLDRAGAVPPGPAGIVPPGPAGSAGAVPLRPAGAVSPGPADAVPPGYANIVPPDPAGALALDPAGALPLDRAGAVSPGPADAVPPGYADIVPLDRVGAAPPGYAGVVPLGPADVPEMAALAVRAGLDPLPPRVLDLGIYLGIRHGGRLVAMAGERARPPGWTEVSAVCVDPDHRGRRLAGRVVGALVAAIQARGEAAYLHASAANATAIRVYESIGFTPRRTTTFHRLRLPGAR